MTTLLLSLCLSLSSNQAVDLTKLANWKLASKALDLSPAHKAALAKNGFFVCPGGFETIDQIYGLNDYDNLSSFITVDNVVDLFHVFFDSTLRQIEEMHLLPSAKKMSDFMLAASIKRYDRSKDGPLGSAALKNVAYFGVAERLSGGTASMPEEAKVMVRAELAQIDKHDGFTPMSIFPYQLDYSQFIVRGHYVRSTQLERYFKTMMWYGLVPIAMADSRGMRLPEQVRQVAMMVEDLFSSPALDEWNRIYSLSSLYAGDANDLTPADWHQVTDSILTPSGSDEKLADDATTGLLVDAARQAMHAAIVSKRIEGTSAGELQFRFMGQRAIPDSVVFTHLTNRERPWPSPLDVGAVLGSSRASAILDASPATYNPLGWQGYTQQRNADVAAWAARPEEYWHANLYTGTLDVLRKVVGPVSDLAPAFMHTKAWADRCLSTALAGWAELRHDTLLYGQQSVAEQGDGDEPQPITKSYVEPNIAVYKRLIDLVKQTSKSLAQFEYLDSKKDRATTSEDFKKFEELLQFFLSVSERELNGGKLTADEHMRLRKIEGDLGELWMELQLAGTNYQILSRDDSDMAVVADVHTAGNDALEVAVGHADDLVAIVPIEGKNYLARGSALSFYEFRVPISQRMTDHAWKAFLEDGKDKPRPSWISSYFVNKPCKKGD